MQIRVKVNTDDPIYFDEFDPSTESEALRLSLNNGRYQVTVYTYDVPSVPPPKPFIKYGLVLEIEMPDPDPSVVEALIAEEVTDSVKEFQREVFTIIATVYRRFEDYTRNIAKQFWIERVFYGRPINRYGFMGWYGQGVYWLDSAGTWRSCLFERVEESAIYEPADYPFGIDRDQAKSIDKKAWEELGRFIQADRPAPMRDVLIANSLSYLEMGDGRLAVVDAVIALETVAKQRVPQVIARLPGASQLNVEYLDRLIEKMGLRAFVGLGLGAVKDLVGLDPKDIETVEKAVEARNSIIHAAKNELPLKVARKYVLSINRIIGAFESWLEEPTVHDDH